MQYFAAFEPFEIFDEFNGIPGTYIKSFLISDTINLNDWQTTHEANLAQEEEEEEKDSKAKKAEEEKDDEEKTALKARIEILEREPIVEKIVASQLSAGIITEDKVSETTSQLMQASKDELHRTLKVSKSFEAKHNSLSANLTVPYYGSEGSAFDASLNDIDDEALLMEVSG